MLPACGGDGYRRICRASSERVSTVGCSPEDGGVAVITQFHSPLERMGLTSESHVVLELVEVPKRPEDRTSGRIKTLEQAIAKANSRLHMVFGGKKWRAADISK